MRTTCVICLPDMFTSEMCFYFSEPYFQCFITEDAERARGMSRRIHDRSLAKEWGLVLPPPVKEIGVELQVIGFDDPNNHFHGERWYYGEVL